MNSLRRIVQDLESFSRALFPEHALRRYQLAAMVPVLEAVRTKSGGTFVLMFSRQSGKDEALSQLLAFLLCRYQRAGGSVVFAAPSQGQCEINRLRLVQHISSERAQLFMPRAKPAAGARVACGGMQIVYRSAAPTAQVRGETASRLLVINEAQDVDPGRYDSVFAPMASSTDAPAVFSGTPWTSDTLLAREADAAERHGRLFKVPWQAVAAELPAYGTFVRRRIGELGAGHPFIQTEFELQTLDQGGGLFDERRQAHMRGDHPRQVEATPGQRIAITLDVAGGDEEQSQLPERRAKERRPDSTALTVYEVDLATVRDPVIQRPSYRVLDRVEWVGVAHTSLYGQLLDLVRSVWAAHWLIVDATGIGAGLSQFLDRALAGEQCKVMPFIFGSKSKSDLGWNFLGVIESGRYKDYADDQAAITRQFWYQVGACRFEVLDGPGRLMRWSVPERLGHDDGLISAALIAHLDTSEEWIPRTATSRRRKDF